MGYFGREVTESPSPLQLSNRIRLKHFARAASVASIVAVVLPTAFAGVGYAQYARNEEYTSWWIDCEEPYGCVSDPITFQQTPMADFVSVSGGTKIYQDIAYGTLDNYPYSDPAGPVVASCAMENDLNGTVTWSGTCDTMQTIGCPGEVPYPQEENSPCKASQYNTNGRVFSGDWYVQYGENIDSDAGWDYDGGTSIAYVVFNQAPASTLYNYSCPSNGGSC